MKKEEIITDVGGVVDIEHHQHYDRARIGDVIDSLSERKKEGATHIGFIVNGYGDIDSISLQCIKIKQESQEDYDNRIKQAEENRQRENKAFIEQEKAMYLQLKQKYEKD